MTETTDQAQPDKKVKEHWWHTVLALAVAIVFVKVGGIVAAISAFSAFYFIRPRFGIAVAALGGLASAAAVAGVAAVMLYSMAVPPASNGKLATDNQPADMSWLDKGSTLVDPQPAR